MIMKSMVLQVVQYELHDSYTASRMLPSSPAMSMWIRRKTQVQLKTSIYYTYASLLGYKYKEYAITVTQGARPSTRLQRYQPEQVVLS